MGMAYLLNNCITFKNRGWACLNSDQPLPWPAQNCHNCG